MKHNRFITSISAVAVLAWSSVAVAQNVDNEVWIGQTGTSNTIGVNQVGAGNLVGAEAQDLRLRQYGIHNSITIDQYGWSNAIGVTAGPNGADPLGFSQTGRSNTATISQENGAELGSNSISTVYQASQDLATSGANRLLIEQSGSGERVGAAGHRIGAVLQVNLDAAAPVNLVTVAQSGGGLSLGNEITRLVQTGTANTISVIQTDTEQSIVNLSQNGDGNDLSLEQGNGGANTVGDVSQSGALNAASIHQSGFRNEITSVFQDNDGIAISGNVIEIMIAGDDNGSDGFGGVGYFGSMADAVGAEQGAITQIGDDNDLSFTITRGDSNLFGFSQIGDGNGADVVIDGDANEVASVQIGDNNSLVVNVEGDGNITAAFVDGEGNRNSVRQKGSLNTASLSVTGADNNRLGSDIQLAELGGGILTFASLEPGLIRQDGIENGASLVIHGNNNVSAIQQTGEYNIAMIQTTGDHNVAAIFQNGADNSAWAQQSGAGNNVAIIQR